MLDNLKATIRTYDYFVAWEKVIGNVSRIEISLNILNSILGKTDVATKVKEILMNYPEAVSVLPLLIAVRDKKIKIADIGGDIEFNFNKQSYTQEEINKIVFFLDKCGLLKVFSDRTIKNLVDYTIGVEVGLDTNARKNRSGIAMEKLVEIYVKSLCDKYKYRYISQATAAKIKSAFNKDVTTDKSDRHFDFAINTDKKLYLIEVNYYSGGGSKLKSVAGEFSKLNNLINTDKIQFIWITDGKGWLTAKRPLSEAFSAIDYVLNIKMIENGFLEEIISKGY
ncbi:MAG: type II restriction endonuclease [Christensenellales bacterium]